MMYFWIILLFVVPVSITLRGTTWIKNNNKHPGLLLIVVVVAMLAGVPFFILTQPVLDKPVLPRILVQRCHWEVRK